MNLTLDTLKTTIQHSLPIDMTYVQAKPLKYGQVKHKRTVGWSKDQWLSVEAIGDPKRLYEIKFMSIVDRQIAARNMVAIGKVLAQVSDVPAETVARELVKLEPDKEWQDGNVKVSRVMAGPLDLYFVSVK